MQTYATVASSTQTTHSDAPGVTEPKQGSSNFFERNRGKSQDGSYWLGSYFSITYCKWQLVALFSFLLWMSDPQGLPPPRTTIAESVRIRRCRLWCWWVQGIWGVVQTSMHYMCMNKHVQHVRRTHNPLTHAHVRTCTHTQTEPDSDR